MQVTFTGEPHEIMQQYATWLKTLESEQKLLYNKIVITGNKQDKVQLSEYKKVIQQIAIDNKGGNENDHIHYSSKTTHTNYSVKLPS